MAISRGNSLLMKKQWAEDGSTVIPNPPVAGTTYRDESVDADNIAEGQQYDGVADSARWNQLLYIITGILKDAMAHGVLPWINTQDYSEGAVVMGSNGTLYIAKKANGPTAKNAKDPATDSAESVWEAVIRLNMDTMALDSAGKILAKDIAIDGNTGDLASDRGFIYDTLLPRVGGDKPISDFNDYKTPGRYHVIWREGEPYSSGGEIVPVTLNNPNARNGAAGFCDAIIDVDYVSSASYVSTTSRCQQKLTLTSNSKLYGKTFVRVQSVSSGNPWFEWVEVITTSSIGEGIVSKDGQLTVPEYVGATSSKPGTAGLVPPATAAERNKFLKGDGTYDSIGEGVYVKKTGDTMSGALKFSNDVLVSTEPWTNVSVADVARDSRLVKVLQDVLDKNGIRFVSLEAAANTDGSRSLQIVVRDAANTTFEIPFRITYYSDGSVGATIGGNNVVRSVNSALADANGNVKLNPMPIGSVYVQFANQPDPTSLFGGTWSNISNSYAGLFFRAEGGAAAAFGGSQGGGLPNASGEFKPGGGNYVGPSEASTASGMFSMVYDKDDSTYRASESGGYNTYKFAANLSRSNSLYGAATEVRPVNSTIRIWKRTA